MKYAIIAIVAIVVIGGIVYYTMNNTTAPANNTTTVTPNPEPTPSPTPSATTPEPNPTPTPSPVTAVKTVQVNITASGFAPKDITINRGDSVKWVNQSEDEVWPASGVHPTHTSYPTTGGCIGSTFDACHGLKTGESFTFQFDIAGNWKYHDHLSASHFGSVTVQ